MPKIADDISNKAADLMKKVVTVGIGTFFLTEESLKNLVSEFKLPKEVISGLLESAEKTKEEFFSAFAREIAGQLISHIDPKQFLNELLVDNEIELKIKVHPRKKSRI